MSDRCKLVVRRVESSSGSSTDSHVDATTGRIWGSPKPMTRRAASSSLDPLFPGKHPRAIFSRVGPRNRLELSAAPRHCPGRRCSRVTVQFIVAMLAYAINERPARRIDYLHEQVRVVKEALAVATGTSRIAFTAEQRRRLALNLPGPLSTSFRRRLDAGVREDCGDRASRRPTM